jgi:hypothetical protein
VALSRAGELGECPGYQCATWSPCNHLSGSAGSTFKNAVGGREARTKHRYTSPIAECIPFHHYSKT